MTQRILCVDDDKDFLLSLRVRVQHECEMLTAHSTQQALETLSQEPLDLVLLDIDLGEESGIECLKQIKVAHPKIDVVMLSGQRDPKVIVDAMRSGATDYLTKQFSTDELFAVILLATKNRQVRERYEALVEKQNSNGNAKEFVYANRAISKLLDQAKQVKGHQANVLITGETGTGKELLARFIHRVEGKLHRPFIAVNCAAIPENLIESELFGAERGSYTGAMQRRIGRFELADGGDIFLDEISSLKLDLQAKILRVLQEKEFTRVGGNELICANFRVLAATNDAIDQMVTRGDFRMDLYHRLRVIQFHIPPLRERPEDIRVLIDHFLQKYAKHGVAKKLSPGAVERLLAYHWPGNVRELENVIHSLVILSSGNTIEVRDLPAWAMNGVATADPKVAMPPLATAVEETVSTLKDFHQHAERRYIEHVLQQAGGDKSKAARLLDVGRTTLYAKLREFGMA